MSDEKVSKWVYDSERSLRQSTQEDCRALLKIIESSNCCDSPLYRDDIEAIKRRVNGSS